VGSVLVSVVELGVVNNACTPAPIAWMMEAADVPDVGAPLPAALPSEEVEESEPPESCA
jgi:hypothetical protein